MSISMNDANKKQLRDLVLKNLDDSLSEEEIIVLEALLLDNEEAQSYYFQLIKVSQGLHHIRELGRDFSIDEPQTTEAKEDIWQALVELAREEETAEALPICQPEESVPEPAPTPAKTRKLSRFWLTTSITSMAALVLIMIAVYVAPPSPYDSVAYVKDSINARWETRPQGLENGALIYPGEFRLQEGYAKFLMDNGAEVILEAPIALNIRSAQEVNLKQGKLFAYVPPAAHGFTVLAHGSRIVDLGTEFGVETQRNQSSSVTVINGEVDLRAATPGAFPSVRVTTAQARKVTATGQKVQTIPFAEHKHVRHISSDMKIVWRGENINLADIVAGGNGLGGQTNQGINIFDGTLGMSLSSTKRKGASQYVVVADHPFVDGVFVPDIGYGPVIVSSDGHVFPHCANASGYVTSLHIHSGWSFPGSMEGVGPHHLHLQGQPQNWSELPCISMGSNQGITFDLDVIRRALPGVTLSSFTSHCGLSDTVKPYRSRIIETLGTPVPVANLYVIVDGQERFSRLHMTPMDDPASVRFKLTEDDRYLTLMVTGGRDRNTLYDWAVFVNPTLEL